MNKKKLIIFIVLVVILVVLCVLGVFSFISYNNNKPKKNQDFGETEIDESKDPYAYDRVFASGEDFLDAVNSEYYNGEKKAELTYDKDGCYKAKGSDGIKYSYCTGGNGISIEG